MVHIPGSFDGGSQGFLFYWTCRKVLQEGQQVVDSQSQYERSPYSDFRHDSVVIGGEVKVKKQQAFFPHHCKAETAQQPPTNSALMAQQGGGWAKG